MVPAWYTVTGMITKNHTTENRKLQSTAAIPHGHGGLRRPRGVTALFLTLALAVAFATPVRGAEPLNPAPYSATYVVTFRGIEGGRIQFVLRSDAPGEFVYESRPEPNLLAKLFISSDAIERSVMRIDDKGVRPLFWSLDDGKSGHKDDGSMAFDWQTGRVRGNMGKEEIDLPTEPGLQDRLSFQVAAMTDLLRGREPGTLLMVDHNKVTRYSYTRLKTEWIKTKVGEFDTVVCQNTRPGSTRVSLVWHAPALGFIPVRAEQIRKGKRETVMELVELHRSPR